MVFFKKIFDESIDRCFLRDAGCELLCVLENFYASGTQHAGVTKSPTLGTADYRLQMGGKMTECEMWAADQGY